MKYNENKLSTALRKLQEKLINSNIQKSNPKHSTLQTVYLHQTPESTIKKQKAKLTVSRWMLAKRLLAKVSTLVFPLRLDGAVKNKTFLQLSDIQLPFYSIHVFFFPSSSDCQNKLRINCDIIGNKISQSNGQFHICAPATELI